MPSSGHSRLALPELLETRGLLRALPSEQPPARAALPGFSRDHVSRFMQGAACISTSFLNLV